MSGPIETRPGTLAETLDAVRQTEGVEPEALFELTFFGHLVPNPDMAGTLAPAISGHQWAAHEALPKPVANAMLAPAAAAHARADRARGGGVVNVLELLHANVCADRYDYHHTWPKRRPAFVAAVKAIDPHLVTLTECQEPAALQLAKQLGYKSESFGGSSILYDPDALTLTRTLLTERWLGGTQTHSLLMVEFAHQVAGYPTFNLGVSHLPPFATRATLRRRQLDLTTSKVRTFRDPTFLAMDANWPKTLEDHVRTKWASARLRAATVQHAGYRTSGGKWGKGNPIDYVLGCHGAQFTYYDVIDGRKWSDHNALNVEIGGW